LRQLRTLRRRAVSREERAAHVDARAKGVRRAEASAVKRGGHGRGAAAALGRGVQTRHPRRCHGNGQGLRAEASAGAGVGIVCHGISGGRAARLRRSACARAHAGQTAARD